MKLNCDMGESFGSWSMGNDVAIMPYIDMANIACGFHASDPVTMGQTVKLAQANNVSVGAHPAYPDLVGFGRRMMDVSDAELAGLLTYQVGALQAICRVNDVTVDYVKPHGALYNKMMRDERTLTVILQTMQRLAPQLPLVVQATPANDKVQALADTYNVPLMFEAFSDRAYDDDGLLVARSVAGSVYRDKAKIEQQILDITQQGYVVSINGKKVPIQADTICVHGDNECALFAVKKVKPALEDPSYANKVYF